jgi:hypothetical protein
MHSTSSAEVRRQVGAASASGGGVLVITKRTRVSVGAPMAACRGMNTIWPG